MLLKPPIITVAKGRCTSEPIPDLTTAGTYHYWVSQFDSTCEGSRTPVTIIVHKKPAKPSVVDEIYCQFMTPHSIQATIDGTDLPEILKYYGPGVPPGTTIAPTPNT